jgi:hypothetical protein
LLGLTEFGISACFDPQNSHGLSFASYDPCSEQRHLQVRADVTVSCRGRRLHPVKKMPNLQVPDPKPVYDLSMRIANPIGLLRAAQSPAGGADRVVQEYDGGICDGGAGAQAGVRHRDRRRTAPHERRETRTVASVLRFKALAACHLQVLMVYL